MNAQLRPNVDLAEFAAEISRQADLPEGCKPSDPYIDGDEPHVAKFRADIEHVTADVHEREWQSAAVPDANEWGIYRAKLARVETAALSAAEIGEMLRENEQVRESNRACGTGFLEFSAQRTWALNCGLALLLRDVRDGLDDLRVRAVWGNRR